MKNYQSLFLLIFPGGLFYLNGFFLDSRSGLYHANFADVQMDELNLEKAYSIEYYKRMFYPEEGMWVS